jgi:hypothetical protein
MLGREREALRTQNIPSLGSKFPRTADPGNPGDIMVSLINNMVFGEWSIFFPTELKKECEHLTSGICSNLMH